MYAGARETLLQGRDRRAGRRSEIDNTLGAERHRREAVEQALARVFVHERKRIERRSRECEAP